MTQVFVRPRIKKKVGKEKVVIDIVVTKHGNMWISEIPNIVPLTQFERLDEAIEYTTEVIQMQTEAIESDFKFNLAWKNENKSILSLETKDYKTLLHYLLQEIRVKTNVTKQQLVDSLCYKNHFIIADCEDPNREISLSGLDKFLTTIGYQINLSFEEIKEP